MKIQAPSPEEMKVLQDAEFFRLKSTLDDKVKQLFRVLKLELEQSLSGASESVPAVLVKAPGRTFRGENHQGFPWRALDFPRLSRKPDLFIFRCLLLWGHHFAFHLICSGSWKEQLLRQCFDAPPKGNWLVDLRGDPWRWSHPEDSGIRADQLSRLPRKEVEDREVLKLSWFHSLEEFDRIPALGRSAWASLQESLFPTTPR